MRLTKAQKELYSQIDPTPGVSSECLAHERRTVDALIRKGLLVITEEHGLGHCEVARAASPSTAKESEKGQKCHRHGIDVMNCVACDYPCRRAPRSTRKTESQAEPSPAPQAEQDDGECPRCWLPKDHEGGCEPAFFRPTERVIEVAPQEDCGGHCGACDTRHGDLEVQIRSLESALTAARAERDRAKFQCTLLHGDNEGQIAHYRDQLITVREERDRAQNALRKLQDERTAAQAYTLRLRQLIYAGDPTVRRRAEREIDEMSLASVLECARSDAEKAISALKPGRQG